MSYSPWVCAFQALTCARARQFYVATAIEHGFLTVAIFALASQRCFQAGQSARVVHNSVLVPFGLLVWAALSARFLSRSASVPVQPRLCGFTPAGVLAPAPVVAVVRASVPVVSGFVPAGLLPPASLSSLSVTQLRQLAKARGIPSTSKLSKSALVQLLR